MGKLVWLKSLYLNNIESKMLVFTYAIKFWLLLNTARIKLSFHYWIIIWYDSNEETPEPLLCANNRFLWIAEVFQIDASHSFLIAMGPFVCVVHCQQWPLSQAWSWGHGHANNHVGVLRHYHASTLYRLVLTTQCRTMLVVKFLEFRSD